MFAAPVAGRAAVDAERRAGRAACSRRRCTPHLLLPPPPQVSGAVQVPQLRVPPQPSPAGPQLKPSAAHVVGTHAAPHLLAPAAAAGLARRAAAALDGAAAPVVDEAALGLLGRARDALRARLGRIGRPERADRRVLLVVAPVGPDRHIDAGVPRSEAASRRPATTRHERSDKPDTPEDTHARSLSLGSQDAR